MSPSLQLAGSVQPASGSPEDELTVPEDEDEDEESIELDTLTQPHSIEG